MVTTRIYKLTAYPKEITLRDGTPVVLRPMEPSDAEALLAFFLEVEPEDRYYLKEDVTSPVVINRWAAELDYDRALPILALADGKIVADGTLHRTRVMARQHVGEVRVLVNPSFRNLGLGTTMVHELASIAYANDLERLLFQAVEGREDAAIKAAEFVGFSRIGSLPSHANDMDGHPRDIVLMEMLLGSWLEMWPF